MAQPKKKPLIMWQPPMVKVVTALVPLSIASIYFFGWRTLVILAIVNAAGFLCELVFARVYKQQVTSAVFVTSFLFALSLPPTIPIWMAVVGIAFAVSFGKMVFGGFGRNIFNPALTGRAFLYVTFVVPMSRWVEPIGGTFGGFTRFAADAVTEATPLGALAAGQAVPWLNLFLGNVAGSAGETCAALALVGGLYLLIRKVASYRIVLGAAGGFLGLQTIFWLANVAGAPDPISAVLSGSIVLAVMFMATDPVSASQTTDGGRWIYGAAIGVLTVLVRTFSVWPEGVTFAILLANMFAPLLDHLLRSRKKANST